MKKIILLLLVLSLLITGCGEKGDNYEKPATKISEPNVKQTTLPGEEVAKTTTKTTTKIETGPALSSEIKKIIDKSDSVSSIEYTLNVWELSEPGYNAHLYVKGNKQKHEFGRMQNAGSASFYNTVYLDTSKKTASAYCENDVICNDNDEILVDYTLFDQVTPFDVLDSLNYGTKVGTEMMSGRETIKVEYTDGDISTVVWIWDYKGLPLKYEVSKGDTKVRRVEFENLAYNGIKDSDITH